MSTAVRKIAADTNEDFLRAALATADPAVLWITLYQLTGDPELGAMRTTEKLVRGGVMATRELPKEYHDTVREKAFRYLTSPHPEAQPPSDEEARALMELFDGEAFSDDETAYSIEELAFHPFSRPVSWTNGRPDEALKDFNVVVIGAGASGVCAAIYLKNLGIPFQVFERQNGVGGTWELNDYPEARVDITSYIYQFKFEKRYPWKHLFAPRQENIDYLDHIVDKYDIRGDIELNVEVTSARWDEARGKWDVTVREADGSVRTVSANVILSGSGLFATPKKPDIPGIDSFKGKMFHTTEWDHSYDWSGKRVAQIGTGSTGCQLMARIARDAKSMTVFQRSKHWIGPAEGYKAPVSEEAQWLLTHLPFYWNWHCYASYATTRRFQDNQEIDKDWQAKGGLINPLNDALRKNLTDYAAMKFKDRPDLFEKIVPSCAPLSKRSIIDNGYYDALAQDHVELVACGIERITENSIIDKEGVEHPVDLIIVAAGFEVQKYLWPAEYVGRDGMTLEKLWEKDGARAYLGMTMPGFPNFFMYYGPNGQPRIGPLHSWFEIWSRYIMTGIIRLVEHGEKSLEVKREVFEDYNRRLDEAYENLIWKHEAPESYYVNDYGRGGVSVSFRMDKYYAMVKAINYEDFLIT